MVATRERQHGERIPRIDKYKTRILPVVAIYGGNASGKSNLCLALASAKQLVVYGTQPDGIIQVEPFRLDRKNLELPTFFGFEILVNETIYAYSFNLSRTSVLEEKLVAISSGTEKVLYDRRKDQIQMDRSLQDDRQIEYVFKGTRDNQLFLTNSISQKVDKFRPVYDWFKHSLEIIGPDSRFEPFEQILDEGNPLHSFMNEVIQKLDTGIVRLCGEKVLIDNIPLETSLLNKLKEIVTEGKAIRLVSRSTNDRYILTREKGELVAKRLVAYHSRDDGSEVRFELKQEADGSLRVIDLIPAFQVLSDPGSSKVFIIDELNRSLHTILTRHLLETYLDTCSANTRTQLLFTTHDLLLMDQQLFRRDEMWITERNHDGISSLVSFSDFKDVRYDKDIRKSYLQGRLGGIPRISPIGGLVGMTRSEQGRRANG